tara:strand:+ start:214 stop:1317 length:1104 start_codon:yes stop_codon:yes gene_type:complete
MKRYINNSQSVEIVRAGSLQECKEAILCCVSNFYPKGYKKRDIKLWEHKWLSDPKFELNNLLLAKKDKKIIGGLRVSSFDLKRLNQTYKCLGISEIFVNNKFRHLRISNDLIDFAIKIAEKKRCDLLLACASKKVNGFYLKKNFYGIGSYSQLEFNEISELKKIEGNSKDVSFKFKPTKFYSKFKKFYNYSYKDVFGRILRDEKKWKFIIKRLKKNKFKLLGIYRNKKIVGYIIHDKHNINEISYEKNIDVKNLIYDLSVFFESNKLEFLISPRHILLNKDYGFDISVKLRDCFYGGHVARIIALDSVVNKFIKREKKNLEKKITKPVSIRHTKILLGVKSQVPFLQRSKKNFSQEPFVFSKVDELF